MDKWCEIPQKKIKSAMLIGQWQKWSKVTIMQGLKVFKREGEFFIFLFWVRLAYMIGFGFEFGFGFELKLIGQGCV